MSMLGIGSQRVSSPGMGMRSCGGYDVGLLRSQLAGLHEMLAEIREWE